MASKCNYWAMQLIITNLSVWTILIASFFLLIFNVFYGFRSRQIMALFFLRWAFFFSFYIFHMLMKWIHRHNKLDNYRRLIPYCVSGSLNNTTNKIYSTSFSQHKCAFDDFIEIRCDNAITFFFVISFVVGCET